MSSLNTTPPVLSAVLYCADTFSDIATTVRHLRAQTIASGIELVIVAPDPERVQVPAEQVAELHSVKVVAVKSQSLAVARAAGVAAASAALVAFNEDHSFPEPGWAAALISAHEKGYAGVAPQMKNGNPASALSWAGMFLHFGGTVELNSGFETDYPAASHNMSYRRAALVDFGDRLPELFLAELFLHEAMRQRGHRFWVEPTAVTRHINLSTLRPSLVHAFVGGRLYGGLRAGLKTWPPLRRLIYAGGSPLIPGLRLGRVTRLMRQTRVGRAQLLRTLPAIALILVIHAAGEATGYIFGTGKTRLTYSRFETRRDLYVRPAERVLWA